MTTTEAEKLIMQYSENKKIQGHPYSLGHILNTAEVACKIAEKCGLDKECAYKYGLLHDIGRLMIYDESGNLIVDDKHRHPIEGYKLLINLGASEEARYCVTHAFLLRKNIYADKYSFDENRLISDIICKPYNDYDKIVQLSDEISVVDGLCPLETRFARQIIENGYQDIYLSNFEMLIKIKEYFSQKCNIDIYSFIFNDLSRIILI